MTLYFCVASSANRYKIFGNIGSLPVAVEFPKRPYVMHDGSFLPAYSTFETVPLSNFLGGFSPVWTAVHAVLSALPISGMPIFGPVFFGPVFIGALHRAAITLAALECSLFFPALLTVPGNLFVFCCWFSAWSFLNGRVLGSAKIRAKPWFPVRPFLKFVLAPIANKCTTLGIVLSFEKRAAFPGAKAILSIVLSFKDSAALFARKLNNGIFFVFCHITSLALVARRKSGAHCLAYSACRQLIRLPKPADILPQMEVTNV